MNVNKFVALIPAIVVIFIGADGKKSPNPSLAQTVVFWYVFRRDVIGSFAPCFLRRLSRGQIVWPAKRCKRDD